MDKSNKIGLGIISEKFCTKVAESTFKKREDFEVKHVDWNKYNYGDGLDLRIFQRNKQIIGVEVKNWRYFKRPYGTQVAEDEIIDRFRNFAGGLKVLIISFLSLLTQKAIRLLEVHNIHIIEVGKLVGKNDFPRRGKDNTVFYSLKSKLSKLWANRRRGGLGCFKGIKVSKVNGYHKLDRYMTSNDITTTNTLTANNITNYDTEPIINNKNRAFRLLNHVLTHSKIPQKQRLKH